MPYLFMNTLIRALAQGRFFRFLFANFLRGAAVLFLIAFLMAGAGLLSSMGSAEGGVGIGKVVCFVVLLIGAYMVVHAILLRAADILHLPDMNFTLLPIFSLILKLLGEVIGACYLTAGVGGGMLMLFAGASAPFNLKSSIPLLGWLPYVESGGFLAGAMLILSGILIGFIVLTLFYLFSEALIMLVDIAGNLQIMRQAITGAATAPGTPPGGQVSYPAASPAGGPINQAAAAPQMGHCYQCGNPLLPGSIFCERCGARVA